MESKSLLDKVCRTCMCEGDEMKYLFETLVDEKTLGDLLQYVASINVYVDDNLPKYICVNCESSIKRSESFKRMCLESDLALKNILDCGKPVDSLDFLVKTEHNSLISSANIANMAFDLNVSGYHDKGKSHKYKDAKTLKRSDNLKLQVKEEHHQEDNSSFDDYNFESFAADHPADDNLVCHCGLKFDDESSFKIHIDLLPCVKSDSTVDGTKLVSGGQNDNVCTICNIEFLSAAEYAVHSRKHIRKFHKKKIPSSDLVSCEVCGKGFSSLRYLKLHVRYKHNKQGMPLGNFQCGMCSLSFDSVEKCQQHTLRHRKKPETFNECPLCQRRFVKKTSLNTHMKNHYKGNTKNVCDICKREFQHPAHLENHILARHTKEEGITCDHCLKKFATQESLNLHQDRLKIARKHQCLLCDKAFYMLSTLKEHMRTHTGEKPFLCNICGKGFSQKNNLAQHVRRHQGLKPFKCENCERRFVSKGELDSHLRKHTGAHPFICDDCGKGFTTSSALVKHRRIHTGERPYACDLCPMRFSASGTLKNHRRTHTGEKPYQCSYCEKAFVQRQDLVSHIRCHTGERPFVCPSCGQSFRKASTLKTHLKIHLKEPLMAGLPVFQVPKTCTAVMTTIEEACP